MSREPHHLHLYASQLLRELCAKYPMDYTPALVWKPYRVTAGMAYYRLKAIGLSTHVLQSEGQVKDTLIHEYAHLLAVYRYGKRGAGHGDAWQQVMRELGQAPKVRHSYEVKRNTQRHEVAYKCDRCGQVLVRSRRLPKRRRYLHVACGGAIKFLERRRVA